MVAKKKSKRGKPGPRRPSRAAAATTLHAEADDSARVIDEWSGTRSGAWASRGFDFQHTVAAWLAARLIASDLQAQTLVPEGLEDITIESDASRHVQVKSRGEHLGAFPVGRASVDVVDAWLRHRKRGGDLDSLTVVFERGVEGEAELRDFDRPLCESLGQVSRLRESITATAKKRGLGERDIQELFDRTVVFGASWSYLDESTRTLLEQPSKRYGQRSLTTWRVSSEPSRPRQPD